MSNGLYVPNQVEAALGGKLMSGFTEGDFITVEFAADDYEEKVGAQGDVALTRIHNPLATVTMRLQQQSPTNDDLSALRDSGMEATAAGFASSFSLRDSSGTSIVQGTAWVRKRPTMAFGNSGGTREWVLGVIVADVNVGGNTRFA